MDGSQKLPQRLLNTIRDLLKSGLPIVHTSLGVAAWIRYATGMDEHGGEIEVKDPLAGQFREIAGLAKTSPARLVDGFLTLREVFGTDLPDNQTFRKALIGHVQSLFNAGALRTVQAIIS